LDSRQAHTRKALNRSCPAPRKAGMWYRAAHDQTTAMECPQAAGRCPSQLVQPQVPGMARMGDRPIRRRGPSDDNQPKKIGPQRALWMLKHLSPRFQRELRDNLRSATIRLPWTEPPRPHLDRHILECGSAIVRPAPIKTPTQNQTAINSRFHCSMNSAATASNSFCDLQNRFCPSFVGNSQNSGVALFVLSRYPP
jgi:hypothetical protein